MVLFRKDKKKMEYVVRVMKVVVVVRLPAGRQVSYGIPLTVYLIDYGS